MENLKRNRTTASEAMAIEDGKMNPFFPKKEYSERYLKLHKERNERLPVRSQRQEFLDKYHSEQVSHLSSDNQASGYIIVGLESRPLGRNTILTGLVSSALL
jgi:hypothetical protein